MSSYWSNADHEAHECQLEIEGERGDEWFEGETKGMVITFWLDSVFDLCDAMNKLESVFPDAKIMLDFETEEHEVTVTNVECEFARDIAQAVAEGIVLSDLTAEKARELLDRETIEHARRYL